MTEAEVLARAARLYKALGEVGFTRDSFIELGESVKAETPFGKLHPEVIRILCRLAKQAV